MNNSTAKILIVDDQLSVRETLKGLLLQEKYNLSFATNGLEALNLVGEVNPDVILLDVMMPEKDGFEVCRRLKTAERWAHIPIILVTALASKAEMVRGIEAGADDFLSKQVHSFEPRARVRSMLRIKKQFDSLQATLQLREDMAAMVVHDLRSPLTPILGISELLLLGNNLSPEQRKDLETILSQTRHLNSLLNDMLVLTKMEQDKLVLNCSPVEISRLIDVGENHRVVAESRQIKLVIDIPPQPKQFLLDTNLFRRVIDNLISNAVKFAPAKSTVTVKVKYPMPAAPAKPGPYLRVQVIDEGPGIPKTHRETVFDKFSVVNLDNKHISQFGLGLAFCKMVVEAHNGKIYVEDNIPKGSIFTVEIPACPNGTNSHNVSTLQNVEEKTDATA